MKNNIDQVCKELLDNADVVMDLSSFPKIVLTFAVIGNIDSKFWEVIFVLDSVFELHIDREYDTISSPNEAYMVLEASVKKMEHEGHEAFLISLGHGSDLDFSAKTVGFNWQANSFNEEEFKTKYSYMFPVKNA